METNQYQEIEKRYQKGIFWVFLNFLPTKKKRENWCKTLYIEKQKDIARKVFYSSKEPQSKKRKYSCIWTDFLDSKMLKLMNNTETLKRWNRTTLLNVCILSAFHILSHQKPKIACETTFMWEKKKMISPEKCL